MYKILDSIVCGTVVVPYGWKKISMRISKISEYVFIYIKNPGEFQLENFDKHKLLLNLER